MGFWSDAFIGGMNVEAFALFWNARLPPITPEMAVSPIVLTNSLREIFLVIVFPIAKL
jgi:hypothetical protein